MLFRVHRIPSTAFTLNVPYVRRKLSTGHLTAATQLPRRMIVDEKDIEEAFLKGSGPGGQKIVRQVLGWSPMVVLSINRFL